MPKLDADVEETVRSFVRLIQATGIPVQEVRVFGSRARGAARANSDIDVCVISPTFGKDRLEETGMLLRVAARFPRRYPLEPVALSPADLNDPFSALAAEIRRDGILVQ